MAPVTTYQPASVPIANYRSRTFFARPTSEITGQTAHTLVLFFLLLKIVSNKRVFLLVGSLLFTSYKQQQRFNLFSDASFLFICYKQQAEVKFVLIFSSDAELSSEIEIVDRQGPLGRYAAGPSVASQKNLQT